MARKTKSTAATETNPEMNTAATATVTAETDATPKKPRKRRPPAAKATPAPDTGDSVANGSTAQKPITGKLGLIAKAVAKPRGASIDDLTEVTGWQPHTVRAALSRLRQRGINTKLTTIGDRKVYQVAEAGT